MKKTLKNILLTGMTAAALTFGSCSGGDGPVTPGPNPNPTPTNKAPTAYASVDKNYGEINKDTFIYDTSASTDDAAGLQSRLDFDGDGTYDTSYAPVGTTNHIYAAGGNMNPVVQVKDAKGLTDTYSIGKVGVLDPANNPITVELQVPKYIVADEEIKANVNATDANSRPLVYSVDWGIGAGNVVDSNNKEHKKTYTNNDVGKHTLEGIAMNDYNIENSATKDVEVGSSIPYTNTVTDKIDGKVYKWKWMDDGRAWLVENFKGKVGDATFYKNDSLNYSTFGRYYNAAEVDEIGDRVMTLNGVEHTFRVATTDEWDALRNVYNQTTGPLKYKEFSNGENVGATNDAGLSLMLGGYRAPDGTNEAFENIGNLGYFYSLVGNDSSRLIIIRKVGTNMARSPPPETLRAPTRLIMKD